MDFSNQITISVPFRSVVLSLVIMTLVFIGVVYYIVKLNKKVNILTPKFGFGGKNISTMVLIAFLAGVAPLVTMLASENSEIRRQAKDSDIVVLNSQIMEKGDDYAVIGFSIVPMRNGIPWAGDDAYSVIWEVTGPTNFTFIEQNLDSENPSYITRKLSLGDYEVKVTVTGRNFSVEKTESLSL